MATSLTQANLSTQSLISESPAPESIAPPYLSLTIRQDSLTVTLDGSTIFVLSASLIFAIQFLQPATVAALIGLATAVLFVQNDYRNFLNLGPGGTPSTVGGYIRINWLKLWALRDPFDPLPADQAVQPASGVLQARPLPYRCGPRPRVVGIAPQRQVDQFGSRECYLALRRILEAHGHAHAEEMGIGTSCFEKHGLGLFARYPVNNTCQGEICHVHNSDHSLHLNLHPEDAREVIGKGWGQRHPLTSRCFLFKMPVPRQFTMVYAPRTRDELKVVCQIIEAAGWWVIAKEIRMDLLGET
ncbi:hypothetical protein SAMD00023353_0302580 [Rosellinia necatrix]|uniref:Luciferase domain-containing protein n=1 Tax=Rosellinia necatrix TaxID=77044 RepID=A0A1W2TDR4_ROSNE|nr:hypothetical protein SAMD00023353_0302580 [Rosellinia necatrix]